MLRMIF